MNKLITFFSPAAVLLGVLLAHPGKGQMVGIGTTTPNAAAALDIQSPTHATGLLIPRLTAAQRTAIAGPPQGLMVYQTDAPEGFWYYAGTPAAWVLLNPTGDNLGNHTAAQNLNMQGFAVVGDGADIGANVGLGIRADGGLNLGQATSGNLLLGYQAGAGLAASSGFSNQLVGYQAGQHLTTGSSNFIGGHQAGASLTGSSFNHIVGYHAAQYATGGYGNQFEGYETGLFNTTGYENYFAGYQSGLANSTGFWNVLVGFKAGTANTTGYENYFAGTRAGLSNTSGSLNHFSGFDAGSGNTSGSYNTFVGASAGWATTVGLNGTGFGNTTLGAGASLGSGTLTNATAIGYQARATQSNSLVLGGTGANAVKVGVGLQAPATELDVQGAIMARNRFVLAPQNGADPASFGIWAADNFNADFRIFSQPNLTASGTTFFTIKGSNGNVGIGSGASPQSTLEVKGTLALTPVLGLAGGPTQATATLLNASSASIIGLNPQAAAPCYVLPPASNCPGRIYLIRNNSGGQSASIYAQGGLFFNGTSDTAISSLALAGGSGSSGLPYKTIWLVSDGVNWLWSGFGYAP